MLPLTHRDSPSIFFRVKEKLLGWQRLIWSDKAVRNLFLFLILNFSFAFVEFFYGFWTNSLGLISDSFHMFFDCTSLVAGLGASLIQKKKANEKYSYGYVRAETIMGFANSLFLVFIAVSIMTHAVERALEPPEVKHDRLFLISVLGLLVNLVGIYAFNHGHAHGDCGHGHSHGHSHGGHNHNHSDHGHSHNHHSHHHHHDIEIEHSHTSSGNSQIMKGVFLHILADTLGSVGVIISAVLMQMFGWLIADPICSMFIAILIVLSVWSLLKESAEVLMQRQPHELDNALPQCYHKVTQLAGVYSVQEQHFWTLCSNNYVGCIKLEVARTVDPRYVIAHTQMIFHAVGVKQLNVQLDYSAS
ncbi:zinc transporter 7 [Copidosoma floridanum]|uniref:zinc transporter 7 n=1 Tax=Copidosoma floridanum TaxID=29053 RepID=UPI0006C974CB|nr:zinc transporter 7 [Copidosoma floridanum]XP_014209061.1 zinc transporter 7 [Copidosoma floridanum]